MKDDEYSPSLPSPCTTVFVLFWCQQDVSRSMFGLASPTLPPNAPRWPGAGLSSLSAIFGKTNNNNNGGGGNRRGSTARGGGSMMGAAGFEGGSSREAGAGIGLSEAEDDPLPLDLVPGNRQPLAIDRRVNDLLRLLRPAPRAMGYRRSVFRFVTRQVGWVCRGTTAAVAVKAEWEDVCVMPVGKIGSMFSK